MDHSKEGLPAESQEIDFLIYKRIGEFVTAETPEEIQEILFELTFLSIKKLEANSQKPDDLKTLELMREEVETGGNWEGMKNKWAQTLGIILPNNEEARRMGLDPHLIYRGKPLFLSRRAENNRKKRISGAENWMKLVEEQFAKVPAKTEPYTHPRIQELEAEATKIFPQN